MDDIIAHARDLGKKIAAHPRCAAFLDAARKVAADEQAQRILRDYQDQLARVRALEETGKPVEPQDKRKLADCEAKVAQSEPLKAMIRHQADYLELMAKINQAIDEASQS